MTDWLLTSLFCLGILFIPVGLALIIIPDRMMEWGKSANRWVSTTDFFDALDKPRNHERFYYRQHHLLGAVITVLSVIIIYMLMFNTGFGLTAAGLDKLAASDFGKWLLQTAYYILIVLCVFTLIAGIIIFARPSLLKSIEEWGNRWVDTQKPLQRFDDVHDIPESIFPGKPRLFGGFVLVCALYIIFFTAVRIF